MSELKRIDIPSGYTEVDFDVYEEILNKLIDIIKNPDLFETILSLPSFPFDLEERKIIENDEMNRNSICFFTKNLNLTLKYNHNKRCLIKIDQIIRFRATLEDKIKSNITRMKEELTRIFVDDKNERIKDISSDILINFFQKYRISDTGFYFGIRLCEYRSGYHFDIFFILTNSDISTRVIHYDHPHRMKDTNDMLKLYKDYVKIYSEFFEESGFPFDYKSERDIEW